MAMPVLAGSHNTTDLQTVAIWHILVYVSGVFGGFWCFWRTLVYVFCALQTLWSRLERIRYTSVPEEDEQLGMDSMANRRNLAHFDVFLNHRGPDVKNTLASHLDAALRRAHCDPFLDARSLVTGKHAFRSINEALTGVEVHVAIFSPRYAESEYCLNELCDMLASEKPIIPVFYKVVPRDLQNAEREGPFSTAFQSHRRSRACRDVEKWATALKKVSSRTGIEFSTNDDEAKLVKNIVAAVLKDLPHPRSIAPARYPVGLKTTSMEVINMLSSMGGNVGVMGICGMGGIGKSTLAREIYNQEELRFESRCFLKDVKDTNAMDLQMKMVKELLGKGVEKMSLDYARWFEVIKKKQVLLVVDNLGDKKQFYELIPDLTKLAPGSRVIITSRESDTLNKILEDLPDTQRGLYFMSELSFEDSLELFINYVFKKKSLDDIEAKFHDNVIKITKACAGVPLALEVIGGFLAHKKDESKCWTEALSVLRKDEDVISRLKISYDALNDEEKQMFLDIASTMHGHPKNKVLEVWYSVGHDTPNSSLTKLIDKCLVKVDVEGRLRMHHLLRNLGRRIVLDKAKHKKLQNPSHIWDPLVAAKVLRRRSDSNEVLAMSLMDIKSPSTVFQAESFAKMKKLKYLLLDKCSIEGDFKGWSEEMRWLQWRHFSNEELPCSRSLPNLAVLDLANSLHLTRVWAGNTDVKEELRMLILSNCKNLKELPYDIDRFKNLKFLDLKGCSSITSLPPSLGHSTTLEELELSGCTRLEELPPLSGLKRLTVLRMSETILSELPEDFGQLCSLIEADFSHCKRLRRLPDSFGNLFSLKEVDFSHCKELVGLPESFGNLSNLEVLQMRGCEQLQEVPSSFGNLSKLARLTLNKTALKVLPHYFGQLRSLKEADFTGCKSLSALPDSIGELSNLEVLSMKGCELLQTLPSSLSKLLKLKKLVLEETGLEELADDLTCPGI